MTTLPVDMIIFCPRCGMQHIDRPGAHLQGCASIGTVTLDHSYCDCARWANPPHKSHECQLCKHVWRHCDVPTNGVVSIGTRGSADHAVRRPIALKVLRRIREALLPFAGAFQERGHKDVDLMTAGVTREHCRGARTACNLIEEHLI